MNKDMSITFRASAELKRAAVAAAKADRRTLASICDIALAEYLERRGEWPAPTSNAPRRRRAAPTIPSTPGKRR